MKVLLIHPEDSPRRGPWAKLKWDRIIDLGKSSASTASSWQKVLGCPVERLAALGHEIEDPRLVGEIFRTQSGSLRDASGIDWWELTCLLVHSEVETALALRRMAAGIHSDAEWYATRPDWPVSGLSALLGKDVCSLSHPKQSTVANGYRRYTRAFGRLTAAQMFEIFFDKYDGGYRWRSRIIRKPPRRSTPVVLLPSAYTNVSRMAAAYASLLPDQRFLLIATRRSGLEFDPRSNVDTAHLGAYATDSLDRSEISDLLQKWEALRERLERVPEVSLLIRAGVLDIFPTWLRNGLAVRNAWQAVLDREPVTAVLCGDDTNWYTRLPVILARKRGLPTVDFHHGAFDGRFLMKDLSSDVYLAKSEMERDYLVRICGLVSEKIIVGAPARSVPPPCEQRLSTDGSTIVFFSEPAESVGGRTEEIYRELLPPLLRLAEEHQRTLTVKLHPFENVQERTRLVNAALGRDVHDKVKIVSGPLSPDLLARAWFGITVESTTVVDCTRHSVPCFLCAWLTATPFGYIDQYARYGVGRLLHSPDELLNIPEALARGQAISIREGSIGQQIDPHELQRLLAGRASVSSPMNHAPLQG